MASYKVLVVGPQPPPVGGMSMQTSMLLRWLCFEGVETQFVPSNAQLRPAPINHIRGVRGLLRLLIMVGRLILALPKADVVHLMANSGGSWFCVSMPTLKLAKFFKVPVILNYRGGGAEAFFTKHMSLLRKDIQSAASIVVPSDFLSNVFKKHGFETHIIPNAVDLAKFKPSHSKPEPFCFIARNLEYIYGNDIAIKALVTVRKKHPNMTLVIAGEGEKQAKLKKLVQDLNLAQAVTFVGKLSHSDMAQFYAKATLLINPSRVDNMPNALIEAQASGTPILSTNVGGIPHMVKHLHTAYLIKEQSVEALAQAWIELLDNSDLRIRMAEQSLQQVQSLGWPRMIKSWIAIYQKTGANLAATR